MTRAVTRLATLAIGWGYALAVSTLVILLAGYYQSGALVEQVALIAIPTFAPFLILALFGRCNRPVLLTVAAVVGLGWIFTVYVDTRPYTGGGASFAVFFGWLSSLIACAVALVAGIALRMSRMVSAPTHPPSTPNRVNEG